MTRHLLTAGAIVLGFLASGSAFGADTPAASGDDKIVCKKFDTTGSRLRKKKVCRTEAQWRETRQNAQEALKAGDRRNSVGPGGQSLPLPGGG